MEKQCKFIIFSVLIVATIPISTVKAKCELDNKAPDATLHLYVHDALSGPQATVWEVARSNNTSSSSTNFGQVRVVDDLITSGPDRNSKKLGRFQGMITSSDMQKNALILNMVFMLDRGKYKGGTISVMGRSEILSQTRELIVTGGTGIYRMVRGYTIASTYHYSSKRGKITYAILEYNVSLYNPL